VDFPIVVHIFSFILDKLATLHSSLYYVAIYDALKLLSVTFH
jgi:hypothetical protein